jgi:hypothetical protein
VLLFLYRLLAQDTFQSAMEKQRAAIQREAARKQGKP